MASLGCWRWIVDEPAPGDWNMAVDEAILDGYVDGDPAVAPTLRLYGWAPPALSLGRTQHLPAAELRAVAEGVDVVRRPTGGGAVLHRSERTYAVVGRLRQPPFAGGVLDTYDRIATVLVEALGELGVAANAAGGGERSASALLCFDGVSAHEITVGGRKLIGSAQLRRRGAFLQHGSIPLRLDGSSPHATDLETAAGRAVDPGEIDRAIGRALARSCGIELRLGRLTADEHERASRYRRERYRSPA